MKKNAGAFLFGLTAIVYAIILLGNQVNWWNINNFSGWWTIIIIIPGLASLIEEGFSFGGLAVTLLGLALFAKTRGWVVISSQYIVIAAFATIGIWLICSSFKGKKTQSYPENFNDNVSKEYITENNFISHNAVFGGVDNTYGNQTITGGSISAVFGGVKLDLSNANICDGAQINCTSIFGGIDIRLPQNCNIKVKGLPVFGGVENKFIGSNDPSAPVITINYTALFGGTSLK